MPAKVARPARIIIVGPANSGSTLLAMVLGSHPEIATVGETSGLTYQVSDFQNYRCSCGELILKCSFWREVETRMRGQGINFHVCDFGSNYRMPELPLIDWLLKKQYRGGIFEIFLRRILGLVPLWQQKRSSVDAVNLALVNTVLTITEKKVFLDSSKNPERLRWLSRLRCETKYIYLVRDGRGVSRSYQRNFKMSLNDAVCAWKKNVRFCEAFVADLPRNEWISVRYEDFCDHPIEEVNRILRFCHISEVNELGSFRGTSNHVLGNEMRLRSETSIRVDERWRTEYTAEHLSTFERLGGSVNAKYGYHPISQLHANG